MSEEMTHTVELELPFHVRIRAGVRQADNWLQLIRFVTVGASGYVVNLGVFAACVHLLGLDYRISAVIAWIVSVLNNFWLNRHWTFDAKHEHPIFQGARFFDGVAGRVRLQLRGADRPRRRDGDEQGPRPGDRDRRGHAAVLPGTEALELPGVSAARRLHRIVCLVFAALLLGGALGTPARAATATAPRRDRALARRDRARTVRVRDRDRDRPEPTRPRL